MSNEKPEAIELADHFDNWVTTFGGHPSGSRSRGAAELRRQHARIQELEKDLGNAKRLTSKIWDKHPEARETIEEGTGAWLVFGQDVETRVSAQRVTQGKDHIAQDRKMAAAPVCETDAQEPVAWRFQTSTGWHSTTDASAALRVSKHHAIEPMYTAPQPQADTLDAARYRYLRDVDWRYSGELEAVIRLQANALWDVKIDEAIAAQTSLHARVQGLEAKEAKPTAPSSVQPQRLAKQQRRINEHHDTRHNTTKHHKMS